LDLAGLLRRRLVGQGVAHRPVGGDGDGLRVGGNGDLGLQGHAGGGDDVAILVELELPGAGVCQFARRLQHLEEAVALDHHIERVAGLRKGSFGEDNLVRRGVRTQTELQPGGNQGLLPGGRAGRQHALIHQVLELRAAHFVADGVGVGQVIGDIVQVQLLGLHAAGGAI
jgi:hypothetical protein